VYRDNCGSGAASNLHREKPEYGASPEQPRFDDAGHLIGYHVLAAFPAMPRPFSAPPSISLPTNHVRVRAVGILAVGRSV
jgi:hypothetical protein